jgi:hypothetical protein
MNEHITKFLDYYIELESSPEYAVMLRGAWGSGKTFFINEYIDTRNEADFLRVSLYGVSSTEEVNESFFQQLYPILGSKTAKIAGKFLKGIVKATIKIDLDKIDGTFDISADPKNTEVPIFLRGIEKKIIVVDDLERCKIPLKVVLGFLNQFVENKGLKMIILANETEILKSQSEEHRDYAIIKEKLIGKSFDVLPDTNSALDLFINEADNGHILAPNKFLLIDIFNTGNYNNLRHLKQAIIDFQYFWRSLPISLVSSKSELERHVIELFFCIAIELNNGELGEEDISDLIEFNFLAGDLPKDSELSRGQKKNQKYQVFENSTQPISIKTFSEYFKYGKLDSRKVEEEILKSSYFEDENTPSWQKLSNFRELEDEDLKTYYEDTLDKLTYGKFDSALDLLIISNNIVNLSNWGLVDISKDEIFRLTKANIISLKDKGTLKESNLEGLKLYWESCSEKFIESTEGQGIYDFIKNQIMEARQGDYINQAKDLLELLPSDIIKFARKVLLCQSSENNFQEIPILSYFDVNTFCEKVLTIKNKEILSFSWYLKDRYKYQYSAEKLIEESKWLESIVHEFRRKVSTEYNLKPKNFQIHNILIPAIENIIKKLKGIDTKI